MVGLSIASAAGEPTIAPQAVEIVLGVGIAGDRYATRRGHWIDPRWRDQQRTLVSRELLDELGLALGALRRNVVAEGLDLNDLIGLEFGTGEAVPRRQRICSPYSYIGRLNQHPGLFSELNGSGAIRVSILRGGTIHVGNAIEIPGLGDPIAEDWQRCPPRNDNSWPH